MKSTLRRLIPAIVIVLLGFIITIVGALFKIQHWPNSNELLVLGKLIEVIGIVIAIFVLIKVYKNKK